MRIDGRGTNDCHCAREDVTTGEVAHGAMFGIVEDGFKVAGWGIARLGHSLCKLCAKGHLRNRRSAIEVQAALASSNHAGFSPGGKWRVKEKAARSALVVWLVLASMSERINAPIVPNVMPLPPKPRA